jgi:hypothetical protein
LAVLIPLRVLLNFRITYSTPSPPPPSALGNIIGLPKCSIVENMGGFSLAASHFLCREYHVIDFSRKTPKGRFWAMCFLLAPSSTGVMIAPVYVLQELMRVVDRWARPPLSVRVAPVVGGSHPFTTLCLSHMIPCVAHKRLPLRLFDVLNCRVPGINSLTWPFHSLLHVGSTVPFLALSFSVAQTFTLERWPMVMIMGSVVGMRALVAVVSHHPPPPDDEGGGLTLGA